MAALDTKVAYICSPEVNLRICYDLGNIIITMAFTQQSADVLYLPCHVIQVINYFQRSLHHIKLSTYSASSMVITDLSSGSSDSFFLEFQVKPQRYSDQLRCYHCNPDRTTGKTLITPSLDEA